MPADAPRDAPYHRLARTDRYRAWKPLVELVLAAALAMLFLTGAFSVLASIFEIPRHQITEQEGAVGLVLLAGSLAMLIPASLLAARLVGRTPGALSSVLGRLRWRWLLRFIAIAVLVHAVALAISLGTTLALGDGDWATDGKAPSWDELQPLLVAITIVIPLQAAGEEYLFRGTLLQVVGAWVRAPWVAISVSAVLFAIAHGVDPKVFIAIAFGGAVMAYLAIRTGGLEASIGLHVVGNVVGFLFIALTGRSSEWMSTLNADLSWVDVLFSCSLDVLYAAIVLRSSTTIPRVRAAPIQIGQ